jgi:hypothetical protein
MEVVRLRNAENELKTMSEIATIPSFSISPS